jgi:raffinose/stachyose/melibiose transport system permease protein
MEPPGAAGAGDPGGVLLPRVVGAAEPVSLSLVGAHPARTGTMAPPTAIAAPSLSTSRRPRMRVHTLSPVGRTGSTGLLLVDDGRRNHFGAGGREYGSAGQIPLASVMRFVFLSRSRRESATDLLFILPVLVILAGFLFYPLAYGIVLSLHDTRGFDVTTFVGLDHYAHAIFGDAVFHRALLNTILFTGVAVVLQTGLGLFLAVIVAEVKRGRTFFQFAFFAPFVLASVAVGEVWRFLFAPYFGIIATVGSALGLDTLTIAPLADANWALWAVLAAFLWRFAGFNMVVYLAAIKALPREYYEFGRLEGAGRFQQFRRITWPLLWPQTFTLVLLTTLGTLRIFDMVWIMTGGGPSHATETVATDVYVTAFRFLQVGYAQAMAMILLFLILLITVVEYRILDRRAEMVSS